MDTQYELENMLASAISEWFETGHVSVEKYPERFHDAIWSQGAIGGDKCSMANCQDNGWITKVTQEQQKEG